MTYWTPEEVVKLHILRRNGSTPLEISVVMGKSEMSVKIKLTRLKKMGCSFKKLRHAGRVYDVAIALQWRALVRQGKKYREIHPHPAIVSRILAMDARGEL